jgi:hypothetical protein
VDIPAFLRIAFGRVLSRNAGANPARIRRRKSRSLHFEEKVSLDPRAQGWKDAKETGHAHEQHVAELLRSDLMFSEKLAFQCFGRGLGAPISVEADGKRAKKVLGILGKKTTSKVDIYVEWSDT